MVTGSPKCWWARWRNAPGRAIHASVCQAAGARGPAGRSMALRLRRSKGRARLAGERSWIGPLWVVMMGLPPGRPSSVEAVERAAARLARCGPHASGFAALVNGGGQGAMEVASLVGREAGEAAE